MEKRVRTRIITRRRVLLVLACIAVPFIVQGTWNMYQSFLRARAESEKKEQEYEALAARRDSVQTQLDSISTRLGMEREIRQRFDVGKPGEELLVVVDRKKEDDGITPIPPSWWKVWLEEIKTFLKR